jgi:cysteinyl-tRNA synthetase
MALRLFNTLSGKIEEFQPIKDNEVRMYACGPTVYDYGHIGNFRTFVAVDLLHRFLRQSSYQVRHVMNITDVDDKIIRNSARDGVSVQQFTVKYETAFIEDSAMINIEPPKLVRATENIPQMAEFVSRLVEKGLAYRAEDGSYYFRSMGSFPRKIFRVCRTARASRPTNMKKTAPAISRCGKRRSRARLRGSQLSGRVGRAGTSSAPSCRCRN